MHDSVSDLLTRIRNAGRAGHEKVAIPHSILKQNICALLVKQGYLRGMTVADGMPKTIVIALKYTGKKIWVIRGIERVSRPGRRVYRGFKDIATVSGGMGLSILSTPKGILSDSQAKETKVGGEVLCRVW